MKTLAERTMAFYLESSCFGKSWWWPYSLLFLSVHNLRYEEKSMSWVVLRVIFATLLAVILLVEGPVTRKMQE